MDKKELAREIEKRAPWYQKIDFPEFGLTTTDKPEWVYPDQAWDNKIGELSIVEATASRPLPKFHAIEAILPDFKGKDVLEIGSNCGFWSFKFAELGASSVTGLEVAKPWLDKARWVSSVLRQHSVKFLHVDFMLYTGLPEVAFESKSLLSDQDHGIPLPNQTHDIVFMSTVLDHMFFPMLTIYKMLRIARETVVIDVPRLSPTEQSERWMKMGMPADASHHGFVFSSELLRAYFQRLGLANEDISEFRYNEGRGVTFTLDVRKRRPRLVGA